MKAFRVTLLFCFLVIGFTQFEAKAQCPMCKTSVESSIDEGNKKGKGLNMGILYLLAMPYIAVAGIGYVWYKKYRKKNIAIDIKDEKINLN